MMSCDMRTRFAREAGVARSTLEAFLVGSPVPPSARTAILAHVARLGWVLKSMVRGELFNAGGSSDRRPLVSARVRGSTGDR